MANDSGISTSPNSSKKQSAGSKDAVENLYHFRWWLSLVVVALSLGAFAMGVGRIGEFSQRVDSLKEIAPENPQPKMFDTRTDIWFDPSDEGLAAYRDVEDKFIAEDAVLVAFEDNEDPWGVFGESSLSLLYQLTYEFQKIPYVRNVRSLTSSPWIRWGQVTPDEEGLLVSDLFDKSINQFSREERLERMIAVLGAEKASALAGEEEVREFLGPHADFSEYAGESRFIDAIVSSDGRTAALQLQVIREKPENSVLSAAFDGRSGQEREVAKALHIIESQGAAVSDVMKSLSKIHNREIHIAGIPVVERHFPEVGQKDMSWLGLMFVVIAVVLFGIFRKFSGVFLPIGVVFLSIFAMNGAVWMNGDLINNLTAMTPLIMTAVGTADAVHIISAYFLLRPQFSKREALIIEVLKRNAAPVFLTSVTTAVAFLSLTVSKIVPVQELGYTAAIGTGAAYLLSMTLVPALLSVLRLPETDPAQGNQGEGGISVRARKFYWTDALADFVERNQLRILLTAALVLLVSIWGVSRLQIESDLRMMFPDDDPVLIDQNWIEAKLGGSGDLDLIFYGASSKKSDEIMESIQSRFEELQIRRLSNDALSSAEEKELLDLKDKLDDEARGRIASDETFLQQVDAFERRLKEESKNPNSGLKVLTSMDSGLSVLRRMHQVQNENRSSFYRVPQKRDVAQEARNARVMIDPFTEEKEYLPAQSASTLAAQYYLQYENGAKPSENLSSFVTPDRRGFRIAGRTTFESNAKMLATYEQIREIARSEFPAIAGTQAQVDAGEALSTMRLTGKNYLFMNMMERFTDTMIISLGLAMLVITLLIGLVYRSVKLALISMIPNVLPLVLPLAVFGILGISLDGPAVIVATIALGVCVDDTIHLLTKFCHARKDGLTTKGAVRRAFRQVGGALTWTTITLVLGFSIVSMSDFRPNMLVGILGACMVGLAWVADLIVTPALLNLLGEKIPATQRSTASLEEGHQHAH